MTSCGARAIQFVPEFRPSLAEFENPLEYFASLSDAGRTFGILKIVTPEGWRPVELPQTEKVFDSFRQRIHLLKTGNDMGTGRDYTTDSYIKYADDAKIEWIRRHTELHRDGNDCMVERSENFTRVAEKSYWLGILDMVECVSEEKMEVDYASNHTLIKYYRRIEVIPAKRRGSWDLSTLIEFDDNLLKWLGMEVAGLTQPWVYFGSLFATFCWHVEDHSLYSVNYLNAGASKIWYGVPSNSADDFEAHFASRVRERQSMDILDRLTAMISPYSFPKSVKVFKAVQEPGDLILTFPRAYHAGYSEGWNCAEAVNFALLDWIPFGEKAFKRYLEPDSTKSAIFSHEQLMMVLMEKDEEDDTDINHFLRDSLQSCCRVELANRSMARSSATHPRECVVESRFQKNGVECAHCKTPLFFSYISCSCKYPNGEVYCFRHGLKQDWFKCCCSRTLFVTRTDFLIEKISCIGN